MAISEQDIKMCRAAVEIREGHVWEQGDWLYGGGDGKTVYVFKGAYWIGDVWLPRQDQLQAMVFQGKDLTYQAIHISKYRKEDEDDSLVLFTSWEQWWLAFVMWKLYHKTWYNEDWKMEDDRDSKRS